MHRPYSLLKALLLSIAVFPATTAAMQAGWDTVQGSSSAYPQGKWIIDSISIDNRNIYDTELERNRHFVFSLANRFHVTTRKSVILRELLFKVGDHFDSTIAEEIARNLRRRLYIYDSWIETETLSPGHLHVKVVTIDVWSLALELNFSREGNEERYQAGLDEKNLAGYNVALSINYFVRTDEDNHVTARISDHRLLGNPISYSLSTNTDPLNKNTSLSVSLPFFNLNQRFSIGLSALKNSGRRDIYDDTLVIARSRPRGDAAALSTSCRLGSYNRKLRFSLSYRYRFESNRQFAFAKGIDSAQKQLALKSFPDDSLYHQPGLGIAVTDRNFYKATKIDGFNYTEDIILGHSAGVSYSRAFGSGLRGFAFDRANMSLAVTGRKGASLWMLAYLRSFWFEGRTDIRRTSTLDFRFYNTRLPWLTVATRLLYQRDWRATSAEGLSLGGSSGLRGYDLHFLTGDRRAIANLEGRFFSGVEFLSAMLGGVVFADIGRTWKADESFSFRDYFFSVGAGLRISLERISRSKIIRIDIAYSESSGLQLSIGNGQYFGGRSPVSP
ncbi:MAG: hypothetical protein ACE5FH_01780 [Candidatus Zixiibacteriota bacterium]